MQKIYDLDGTLSTLNNTWDFILQYHKDHNMARYILSRAVNSVLERIGFIPYYKRRMLQIYVAFYGLRRLALRKYYHERYNQRFVASLTTLGKTVLRSHERAMLLTGCTEIPAKEISRYLGLDVTCTEFRCKSGRITGISQDTYGNLKLNFLKDYDYVYYTDDIHNENELCSRMKKVVVVHE